jgi:hypothetical protein
MPTAWLVKIAAVAAAAFALLAAGWRLGVDHVQAGEAREKALIQLAANAVEDRTAQQIAGIKVTSQTVNAKVREIVKENTVYRDCVLDAATSSLLDAARAGTAFPPLDRGQLPAPGASAP